MHWTNYCLPFMKYQQKKKEKKKRRQKHLHNVVECPLTQMRNQGSCFQINTYCFKMKLNGKQCFPLYPLSRPLNSLWSSFYYFWFLIFLFFSLTTGSARFLYTYLCIFLLLVENKFCIICFKPCHLLFFAMDIGK